MPPSYVGNFKCPQKERFPYITLNDPKVTPFFRLDNWAIMSLSYAFSSWIIHSQHKIPHISALNIEKNHISIHINKNHKNNGIINLLYHICEFYYGGQTLKVNLNIIHIARLILSISKHDCKQSTSPIWNLES